MNYNNKRIMILQFLENIFNNVVLQLFGFIYKYCNIETIEDKYHKDKKHNNKSMNKVKIEFINKDEFDNVKKNVLKIIENHNFLFKYRISTESILNGKNNKLSIIFKDNCIIIYCNHYYISGPAMFILLNQIMDATPPKFLQTNPLFGIIYLPFYIYDLISLRKKEYTKNNKEHVHLIVKKNICSSIYSQHKRFYLYWSVLNKVYKSLQMNRTMTVALSIAFDEVPYITNNVGLIIINYDITDSIEIVEQKIKNAYYQAYVSNFILNCPLPDMGSFELREYVDCIISSMYIKSDYDFKIGWNASKSVIEQMYVGTVSLLRSDNTMDINMVFNTSSINYSNQEDYIENFFEE